MVLQLLGKTTTSRARFWSPLQSARSDSHDWQDPYAPRQKAPLPLIALIALFVTGSVGYIGATAYWILRDDVLVTAQSERAQLENNYQTRIERLRAEIDRLTSSQAIDRHTVEAQVEQLVRRQQSIMQKHEVVSALMERAARNGLHLASEALLPVSKPKIDDNLAQEINPATADAVGGENEPLANPFDAIGLRGSSSIMAPAVTSEEVEEEISSLGNVRDDLAGIDRDNNAALDALAVAAENRSQKIRTITQKLGLKRPMSAAAAASAMGGPYEPIADGTFAARVDRAQRALQDLTILHLQVKHIPLGHPIPGARISSNYGPRVDPFLGKMAMHTGIDYKARTGTAVLSTAPGTVIHAGYKGGYGKVVEIQHANGLISRYAHLSRILVSKGDKITQNTFIGKVGTTGRSTGPHLHYEIRTKKSALNPKDFIRAGERLEPLLNS